MIYVIVFIVALVLGVLIGVLYEKKNSHKVIDSLKDLSNRLQAKIDVIKEKDAKELSSRENMLRDFREVSQHIFRDNNEQFLNLAKKTLESEQSKQLGNFNLKEAKINEMVEPINRLLSDVKEKMSVIEKDYSQTFTEAKMEFKIIKDDQSNLRRETQNLVNILKRPEGRGAWGEIQLRRIVELSGMVSNIDFVEQTTLNVDGANFRPDMIVNLPGDRIVIVDAKAPMNAFISLSEEDSGSTFEQSEYKELLNKHCKNVRAHIKNLASKSYWDMFENSPEFIVMFLPNEAFYQKAVEGDVELLDYAMSNNVLMCTPTTLLGLLKSIAYGWKESDLQENAREISRLGKEMYDRVSVFATSFAGMRKSLEKTVDAYNASVRSFEGRILPQARKFKSLGISSDKNIDELEFLETPIKEPKELYE